MISGCFTALTTPFNDIDQNVDYAGLERLVDFQIKNGISGILAVGTTGESTTLSWEEHNRVVECVAEKTKNKCMSIAGTGSNNTNEALEATSHAQKAGVDAVLLVDPYYNGPSSLEIRKEYLEPVAKSFPDINIIPYVIPGRTGTQIFPEDLAILNDNFENINTVKEATGNLENMKRTRKCCGQNFSILSGDDGITFKMMTDPMIKAGGVISVISNIAPKAVAEMVGLIKKGDKSGAKKIESTLTPFFNLVSVTTKEKTAYGEVICRTRNPLPVKVLMHILGMPSGGCRKPLGKMTQQGIRVILDAARKVNSENSDILKPVSDFFDVDINERLNDPLFIKNLFYSEY